MNTYKVTCYSIPASNFDNFTIKVNAETEESAQLKVEGDIGWLVKSIEKINKGERTWKR